MIPILLRDLRWRLLLLLLLAALMYRLEPAFHQHGQEIDPEQALGLSPAGVSATLSYFAGLAMIVLLAGFVSTDRREGYSRLFFAHPTRPISLYALRWGLALLLALAGAALFLVLGQVLAWGEFRGGWAGLLLALASAVVYGGLMAFLSAALPRGDAWTAFLLFAFPTFFPQLLELVLAGLPAAMRQLLIFLLPPQGALQVVWQGLLDGVVVWPGMAFALGYGAVWLAAAALLVQLRELP